MEETISYLWIRKKVAMKPFTIVSFVRCPFSLKSAATSQLPLLKTTIHRAAALCSRRFIAIA
jgi:hypothetical protein